MKKLALVLGVFCLMAFAGSAFADPVVLSVSDGSGGSAAIGRHRAGGGVGLKRAPWKAGLSATGTIQ